MIPEAIKKMNNSGRPIMLLDVNLANNQDSRRRGERLSPF